MNKNTIRTIPKLDLHCHIDGSFSAAFVKKTLGLSDTAEEVARKIHADKNCSSLNEYLTCFDLPIRCMQTKADITSGILDILEQCHREHIVYTELRFAPTCSINAQINYNDVYEAAIEGIKDGHKKYGIYSNLIVCAMRHHSEEDNLRMLRCAASYLGYGICALDLAGDESAHGNQEFETLFLEAKRLNMPFTIHSGECGSIKNVQLALEYGASRIGHGISLIGDKSLIEKCRSKRIGLELCPTSNYQTKAINPCEKYPLREFLDLGLLASVNTDNRTVSNTTLTNEYVFLCEKQNICENDFELLYKNSVEISFADDSIKEELLKLI